MRWPPALFGKADASPNLSTYNIDAVVKKYVDKPGVLTAVERYCVSRVPPEMRGAILDIGIGGGRTTPALAEMFRSYVGIDYAEEMVKAAQGRYPGIDLRVMDGSKLEFEEEFDVVMFSFNGIDSVDIDTRLAIQREMARVLKPGGYMIYSSHNLGYERATVWARSFWVSELRPRYRSELRRLINRWRYFRSARRADDRGIAYVNDPGENFRLINAYVDIPREVERIEALGMAVDTIMGSSKSEPGYDEQDNWVYFVARKPLSA